MLLLLRASAAQTPECEDVAHLPPEEDACAFVQQYCTRQSYFVFHLKNYYCHIRPKGPVVCAVVLVSGRADGGPERAGGVPCCAQGGRGLARLLLGL